MSLCITSASAYSKAFIHFFIQQQFSTQPEINCQISERVTEQESSHEETELINKIKTSEKVIKKIGRERQSNAGGG